MAKQKAVPHGAGAGAHSGKGGPRKHRAGARITKVQDAFKKGGELAAFRKGAALRLSCSSIYKWCMAWRAQGIEPVVTPDPAAKLVNPLTKKGLKRLAKSHHQAARRDRQQRRRGSRDGAAAPDSCVRLAGGQTSVPHHGQK